MLVKLKQKTINIGSGLEVDWKWNESGMKVDWKWTIHKLNV